MVLDKDCTKNLLIIKPRSDMVASDFMRIFGAVLKIL